MPLDTYDETIAVLRRRLEAARLGHSEKTDGLKRWDGFVRAIEQRLAPDADFDAALDHERAISSSLGGRTVFDPEAPKPARTLDRGQLRLF